MATRVLLDTDIGTDVDDCLALALLLNSPELELAGVTCVYGDVLLRTRMILKLLNLFGASNMPVCAGAQRPLLGLKPVFWAGHEGEGLLEPEDDNLAPNPLYAPDFLVRSVMENPGQLHLIAIGPLTNVALAIMREPKFAANLGRLTIMGGAIRGADRLDLPVAEHNIKCDPEAAHVVLTSGAPITLVPLDVTTQVRTRRGDEDRIRMRGGYFREAVAHQLEIYPIFRSNGSTNLHDPLAVGAVAQPGLVDLRPLHVSVELRGRYTTGATLMQEPTQDMPANAQVAVAVKVREFEELFLSRLSS